MKTSAKRNLSQDRKRVSSEKHEIAYAANRLKSGRVTPAIAKAAILRAKEKLGRTTNRKEVMELATKIVKTDP